MTDQISTPPDLTSGQDRAGTRPPMLALAMALLGILLGLLLAAGQLDLSREILGVLVSALFIGMLPVIFRRRSVRTADDRRAHMPPPVPEVTAADIQPVEEPVEPETEPQEPATVHPEAPLADPDEIAELRQAIDHDRHNFERFISGAPIGIIVVTQDGSINRANGAVGRMFGSRGKEIGRNWVEFVDEKDRDAALLRQTQLMEGNDSVEPVEVKLAGSAARVARIHGTWLDRVDHERVVVFYLIDATEQRSLEAQFAQSQKMQAVGQLAGGVAHDFNNLLTAMIGFSDLLLMRHPPGDPSYADIVHIKQNANRAAALVRQLLAFSRRQTLRPKVLNLTDVLADLSDLLRRLIGEHLNLRIVHDRDLGLVKVDQGQIEQVVTNLVVNARDAMESGGTVSLETRNVRIDVPEPVGDEIMPVGDYVEIAVIDSGHGISAENIAKIFEPFFTTKEVGQGTGLGLATVYGIVRQTGGYVLVESKVDAGTTFRILLPRVDADPETTGASSRRASVDLTGQGTILLVEDEDAVRMFAVRALRNKGYTVLEADSGDTALEIISKGEHEIDLMVSDVVMPNMDGPTLIRRAREVRPDIRAVFISGYAEEAFRRSLGEDLTDVEFLAKPFSLKDLAAKVKEQLGS
ncbi:MULTISPECIES: ATP-binding protein [unclassified Minwuia]|uniref:ATP-binding protein n=1 Tax=unclassified Minwuia TaxID=2618799 RepID=UPI002478A8B4|nr:MULTISPECIES: ATP-binding protein [unclassified Minwuia]